MILHTKRIKVALAVLFAILMVLMYLTSRVLLVGLEEEEVCVRECVCGCESV